MNLRKSVCCRADAESLCFLMAMITFMNMASMLHLFAEKSVFPNYLSFADVMVEGIAVDKTGNVFVSVRAATDQVWKFSPSGAGAMLADLGGPGGGATGLAVDSTGNLYAGRVGAGVFRIGPDGDPQLIPGSDLMEFPNALAFDHRGNLYITESFTIDDAGNFGPGGIWRVAGGGTAEPWIQGELFTGLPPNLFPYPIGANGIGFYHGDLYVANTDMGWIVRVPVLPDGSPGQAEIWKYVEDVPESIFYGSPEFPIMLDGLALDVHGNIYVAVISRNAIVRVNAEDRSQQTVAFFPDVPFDAPASLAFGTGKGERKKLFIANLGVYGMIIPGYPWPGAGVVKIDAGVPGLPLP